MCTEGWLAKLPVVGESVAAGTGYFYLKKQAMPQGGDALQQLQVLRAKLASMGVSLGEYAAWRATARCWRQLQQGHLQQSHQGGQARPATPRSLFPC